MCFFFKQKTAYEMRISDWSSDVCSSDLCIRIGESRDLETMSTTIDAALTGHTVYTTLHTNGVAETIQRVTGMFPDSIRQERVLALLESLHMIVSQTLVQTMDGRRAAAREFLVFDQRSEEHTSELQSLMRISYAVFCLKKKRKTMKRKVKATKTS